MKLFCVETIFGDPHRYDDYLRDCADRVDSKAIGRHLAMYPTPRAELLEEISRRATRAWMKDATPMNSRALFHLYEELLPYTKEATLEQVIWDTFNLNKGGTGLTDGLLDEIVPRMRITMCAYTAAQSPFRLSHNKSTKKIRYRPRFLRRMSSLDTHHSDSCVIS
jgi:hypothetical protein